MTNTNVDSPSSETLLTQSRRAPDFDQQRSDFHNSKSMFEGYFIFNNAFLHIRTNNKHLCINTLLAAVKYLSQFR